MNFTDKALTRNECFRRNFAELRNLVCSEKWQKSLREESETLETGFLKHFADGDFVVWDNIVPAHQGTKEQKLSHIFRTQAERSGSFISNEMVVIPSYFFDTLKEKLKEEAGAYADGESAEFSVFSMPKKLDTDTYDLGFIQIHSKDRKTNFSLPAVIIPDEYHDFLVDNANTSLLDNVGKLASLVNHDYLHHFTSDLLVKTIASNIEHHSYFIKENWYIDFQKGDTGPEGYETWALLSHAKTFGLRLQEDTDFENTFSDLIEDIFEDIEALADAGEDNAFNQKAQNFFSNLSIFMLMRVLPTNHPVMVDCAHRQNEMLRDTGYSTFELSKNPWRGDAKNMTSMLRRFFRAAHIRVDTSIPPEDEQAFRLEYIRRIAPEISYVVTQQANCSETLSQRVPNYVERIERKNAAMVKSLESDLIMDGFFESPFRKPI